MQKIILIILLLGLCKFSNAQEVSKNHIKTLGIFGNTIHDYTIKAFLKLDSLEVKNVNVTGTFYTSFQVTNNQIKNLGFFMAALISSEKL